MYNTVQDGQTAQRIHQQTRATEEAREREGKIFFKRKERVMDKEKLVEEIIHIATKPCYSKKCGIEQPCQLGMCSDMAKAISDHFPSLIKEFAKIDKDRVREEIGIALGLQPNDWYALSQAECIVNGLAQAKDIIKVKG